MENLEFSVAILKADNWDILAAVPTIYKQDHKIRFYVPKLYSDTHHLFHP